MNKKNIIILTSTTILFIVALALFIYAKSINPKKANQEATNSISQKENENKTETEQGPYFFDIDGNKLSFNQFSDKPIVLFVWKSDDSKSYPIIDLMEKYYEQYKSGINFLAVNVNEPNTDAKLIEHIKAIGFTIPIYFDTDFTLYDEFYYEKLPDIIFIDEEGKIYNEVLENIDEDTFTANLDLLIKNY